MIRSMAVKLLSTGRIRRNINGDVGISLDLYCASDTHAKTALSQFVLLGIYLKQHFALFVRVLDRVGYKSRVVFTEVSIKNGSLFLLMKIGLIRVLG